MNVENLERMISHLKNKHKLKLDQDVLEMEVYKSNRNAVIEFVDKGFGNLDTLCSSPGCVIGDSVELDIELFISELNIGGTKSRMSAINTAFTKWSEKFTGLKSICEEWNWLFSSWWEDVDKTPKGACQRMRFLINGGKIPGNFKELHRICFDIDFDEDFIGPENIQMLKEMKSVYQNIEI